MNETSFIDALRDSPGDRTLLQEYADWLIAQGDPRGQHLSAELGVYKAEDRLYDADDLLTKYRSTRPKDFNWLNSIFPMLTKAPVSGTVYSCPEPGADPFVEPGTYCDRYTRVAIIESNNIFYPVLAGHCGMVTDVFFTFGAKVNTGDILVQIIRPQKPTGDEYTG